MKFCLSIIILFLPLITSAKSQFDTITEETIDSILQKEIRTAGEIDLLIDVINSFESTYFLKFRVLMVLKEELDWENPRWYRFRVLFDAFEQFQLRSYDKALDLFIEYVELCDKEKLIMGLVDPLGLIRVAFQYDHEERLKYYQEKLEYYRKHGPKENMATCYHGIAGYYYYAGNYSTAITYYMMARDLYKDWSDFGYANETSTIGDCYRRWGNYSKAKEYLEESIPLIESAGVGSTYFSKISLVHILRFQKEYDEALKILTDMLNQFGKADGPVNKALILLELGQVYLDLNQADNGLSYLEKARALGDSIELKMMNTSNPYVIDFAFYRYFVQVGALDLAEKKLLNGLDIAIQQNALDHTMFHYKELMQFYNSRQQYDKSSFYGLKYMNISDSLENKINSNAIAKYEVELIEFESQQEIIRLEQKRRENMIYSFFVILFLVFSAIGLYFRMRFIRKSKNIIEHEKNRSERLLLNILPYEVAEELKSEGKVAAKEFDEVSIIFSDFKEFTMLAEAMNSKDLVFELDTCFRAFDHICEKYKIEKIKTIGDSYMAAGGIPIQTASSAKDTVLAAIEMQDFIIKRKTLLSESNLPYFEMRAGVNSGPVVAGIVGVKKFQYDIWGDTVNTASRMESNGEVGQVNISSSTYELLKDDGAFVFESRGKIQVKGKGEIEMYFVRRA